MSEFLVHVHGPFCYPKQADHVLSEMNKRKGNHGIQDHNGKDPGKVSTPMLSPTFSCRSTVMRLHSGRGDRHGWTIG